MCWLAVSGPNRKAAASRTLMKYRLKAQTNRVRPDTARRVARWREMAAVIANNNPGVSRIQIARAIQRSAAGKRNGGVLPYSVSAILKCIRTV